METKKKDPSLPGASGGVGMSKRSTEDFQGSENTLDDTMMRNLGHSALVQIHTMANTRRER